MNRRVAVLAAVITAHLSTGALTPAPASAAGMVSVGEAVVTETTEGCPPGDIRWVIENRGPLTLAAYHGLCFRPTEGYQHHLSLALNVADAAALAGADPATATLFIDTTTQRELPLPPANPLGGGQRPALTCSPTLEATAGNNGLAWIAECDSWWNGTGPTSWSTVRVYLIPDGTPRTPSTPPAAATEAGLTGPSMPATTDEADTLRLYRAALGRDPEGAGAAYWLGLQRGGVSLDRIAAEFAASPEFAATYGPSLTSAEFVAVVYRNVLGREGDPAGARYWVGLIDGGLSRAQVLRWFASAAETRAAWPVAGR